MEKKKIIKIQNLYKSFNIGKRKNTVLEDINLEIYKGELITIFGPSGCGKSTLLNTVMGIEKPDSGNIFILGMHLWDMNADDRADIRKRSIGVVYQQQNWIKSLTILENITFSAQLLGLSKAESHKKALENISKVGMLEFKNQYATELSAGEQQKMGLARALISNPQVIIADEPTGNLDTDNGYEVLNILKDLTKQSTTVVLVTHNPEYLEFSDRVAVMKDGHLIDIVENKNGIRKEVEQVIDSKQITRESTNINGTTTQQHNSELDYPEEPLLEKLTSHLISIPRFFIESTILLFSILLSKISPSKGEKLRAKIDSRVNTHKGKISKEISSYALTEISFKNLFFKKFRTIVTIFGVGLGTGFVLLLLSLGYGFEKIVIDEITTAQNLKQIDAYPKVGSLLVLNDELINKIEDISEIEKIYKIKNLAGRLNYKGSTADVVVYGIEDGYLENGSSKKLSGEYISGNSQENQMLVNTEYLNLFGLNKDEIVGQSMEMEIVESLPVDSEEKKTVQVTVSGVIEDDYPPVVYLKMQSIEEYTSENYSQVTIVVNSQSNLDTTRKQIESLGLETFSVMDTVNQVESMFKYVRYGLLFFGIAAFAISFLGMVNTLVVSLLERTREVGLMKIIGMKKKEIKSMFITESMFIGFLGGILGILFGFLEGYLVSLIIYALSMSKGVEFVLISSIPIYLIILIIVSTTLLGFLTGLYPANRAIKIAPLDALRYE
jgi:ABC-type lipoprotein export system ATPase subunit/ABC-type lipoprotein release transport system permease subunit